MQINIDEKEMQELAIKQIQKRMGDRINSLMNDWDWDSYMKSAIDRVVMEKVTEEAVARIIGNLDRESLVKNISSRLAEEIADSLNN